MATKNNKKKIILIGLGTAAAGVLTFFGWQYFSKRNNNVTEDNLTLPSPEEKDFTSHTSLPVRNDDFPLKRGSRGQRVKAMQEALITKYGKNILPKFGSDGDFGSEMVAALKKAGLPETIDESAYNAITKPTKSNNTVVDPSLIAKVLYKAATEKNLTQILSALKLIRNRENYSAVSKEFQQYRMDGVRKTLVNGMLDSFSNEGQKQQIRLEFSKMGLKYDGETWSLSGIGGMTLITRKNATVWRTPFENAEVPAKTILGTEIGELNGFTAFENNGERFLVHTKNIETL